MILGFHFIFSAYGFWLPNDPRGSWSDTVRRHALLAFGPATKVTATRSLAADSHDAGERARAKRALKYPPVRFTGRQARAVASGLRVACEARGYAPFALAVLPDHVHLVLGQHRRPVKQIAAHLKASATAALNTAGLNPMRCYATADGRIPSPWARGYWCPFVGSDEHMRRVIRYVENNPPKAGLPPQRWPFVQPWGG